MRTHSGQEHSALCCSYGDDVWCDGQDICRVQSIDNIPQQPDGVIDRSTQRFHRIAAWNSTSSEFRYLKIIDVKVKPDDGSREGMEWNRG